MTSHIKRKAGNFSIPDDMDKATRNVVEILNQAEKDLADLDTGPGDHAAVAIHNVNATVVFSVTDVLIDVMTTASTMLAGLAATRHMTGGYELPRVTEDMLDTSDMVENRTEMDFALMKDDGEVH